MDNRHLHLLVPNAMIGASFGALMYDPCGWKAFALGVSVLFWFVTFTCFTNHQSVQKIIAEAAEQSIEFGDRLDTIEEALTNIPLTVAELEKRLVSVQNLVGFKSLGR